VFSVDCTGTGNKFPSSFESTVRKLVRLQMHVLSHVYRSHWRQLVALQLQPHFNTLLHHLMLFAHQFQLLVDARDSRDALIERLYERLRQRSILAAPPPSSPDTEQLTSREPASDAADHDSIS